MTIPYALLAMLSYQPMTGYDLKKRMQDTTFMYWSGNNNQIYKALVELLDAGHVTNEVHHQDGAPSKKVYTITEAGLDALRQGSLGRPELPETRKPFLVQMVGAWQLGNAELDTLLDQYEQEIRGQLFIEQSKYNAGGFAHGAPARAGILWGLAIENTIAGYQQELAWIEQARQTLAEAGDCEAAYPMPHPTTKQNPEKEPSMQYSIIKKGTQQYLLVHPDGNTIQTEQDGLDLVALCIQHGTNLIMIPSEALLDDFFRLATGLAGAILQKFTQYNIKTAIILEEGRAKGKFQDFMAESNRGAQFRAYSSAEEAEGWLLSE